MLRKFSTQACRNAVTDLSRYPSPGSRLHGFTLLRSQHVPELHLTALHLQHERTGADYLHIAREDGNNVFSIGFRTNPPDATGVPHILEHTALCGSQKYPIRDPFFKMLPRTLSNFMNALTASDHTYYPFATTNPQDFKNLMAVYLDATLHPLLKSSDFAQEGWRIGPEDSAARQDDSQPSNHEAESHALSPGEGEKLVFKGVVYNEMKGQMSDAGYLFYIRFQEHIFPDIKNSGGDPSKITDLTHEQLKQFHQDHYHPSNAKIFTYGDMPLEVHMQEIDARLRKFDRIQTDDKVHRPIDLLAKGPISVTECGPPDPLVSPERQYKTSISWVTNDTADILESFSMSLLSSLLMDGYGSPLYRGLVETGLGTDWSPNTGFDASGRLGIFSVGLSGVQEADVSKLKPRLQEILRETRKNGFDRAKIDGLLHQLELALKHKTANFGMSLLNRLKPGWFTGVDPLNSLQWNSTIASFETEYAKGEYLESLIDKYLLNDHTMSFTMAPSVTYEAEVAREEQVRLAGKIKDKMVNLSVDQSGIQRHFEERERALAVEQDRSKTENLDCLPTVHVKDIQRTRESATFRDESLDNIPVQWLETPTNGLTYFRAISVLDNLPDELRELIPLFTDSIMRLGTKGKTVEQLEDLIKLRTGGISVGYHVTAAPSDLSRAEEGVVMTGMALDRNVPAMMNLLREIVAETDFDGPDATRKIRQLLQASADGLVDSIASSGHHFARGFAESGLNRVAWLRQQVSGLSQARLITSLASRPEEDGLEDVIEKLRRIKQLVLNGRNLRASISCGAEGVTDNAASLRKFASWARPQHSGSTEPMPTPTATEQTSKPKGNALARATFFPLPYQVYFGGLAVATAPYVSADSAPLRLLASILTHRHLHHEIREKGGAYGGGSYASPLGGIFGFYSYRDPNPSRTVAVMRTAGQWAAQREWTARDLEEAKISVFKGVDAPRAVSAVGTDRFLSGISAAMKQAHRERLLDTTAAQLRDVAQRYLVDALGRGDERVAFLGPRRDSFAADDGWDVVQMDVKGAHSTA